MSRVSDLELEQRAQVFEAAMRARDPVWTVSEIAEKTGIHHSTVSRIVRGVQAGPVPRVRTIARLLSIPISHLFDDELLEPQSPPLEEVPTSA